MGVTGVYMKAQAITVAGLKASKLGRGVTLLLVAASALMTVGCSTPEYGSTSQTKSAYQSCVEQLSVFGRANECAASTTATSTTSTPFTTYYSQYGYTYLNGKLTERSEAEVMSDYIDTLDVETAKELTSRWQSLADQAPLASVSK